MSQHGETHPAAEEEARAGEGQQQPVRADEPAVYGIQVQGRLREGWSDWFDGMTVSADTVAPGLTITTLTGPVADQAALHGRLMRIRDLGLVLLSVQRLAGAPVEE